MAAGLAVLLSLGFAFPAWGEPDKEPKPAGGAVPRSECPFRHLIIERDAAGKALSERFSELQDQASCDAVARLEELFNRLKPGAERFVETAAAAFSAPGADRRPAFDLGAVRFSLFVQLDPRVNAYYYPGGRYVEVTSAFVEKTRRDRNSAAWVLGHELAHAVQDAFGRMSSDCEATVEAQADLWGVEIVTLAGLPAARPYSSIANAFGEIWIRGGEPEQACPTHPIARARY
ncbi:MAG: M48 family metalloprotease, partial [Elusimicrobia bacterium]|nr:M48 family metalloprotease [Elusimicrobiota bacterium]